MTSTGTLSWFCVVTSGARPALGRHVLAVLHHKHETFFSLDNKEGNLRLIIHYSINEGRLGIFWFFAYWNIATTHEPFSFNFMVLVFISFRVMLWSWCVFCFVFTNLVAKLHKWRDMRDSNPLMCESKWVCKFLFYFLIGVSIHISLMCR